MSGCKEEGCVKFFNDDKGYGFITRENGPDLFVHFRNIEESAESQGSYKTLKQGDIVMFHQGEGRKGPQAEFVEVKQSASGQGGDRGGDRGDRGDRHERHEETYHRR